MKSSNSSFSDTEFYEVLADCVDRHRAGEVVDLSGLGDKYPTEWVTRFERAFWQEVSDVATLEGGCPASPITSSSLVPIGPPPEVRGLEIERFLDHGGCADVWLAKAEAGYVVVKVVRKQVADTELQGLHCYKRLGDDPMMGLVPIHHIGRCERSGRLCYTMPLADSLNGRAVSIEEYEPFTLGAWIKKRGGLSPEEALEVAREILPSLGKVHGKGLVHRDIKPTNLVRLHGRWCIGDTGLLIDEELLDEHSMAGTPWYLPPKGRVFDRTVDLFAFGKTLYEMLVRDRDQFPTPKPEHLLPGQDEAFYRGIYDVIDRACGEDPKDWYDSAASMLGDLPDRPVVKLWRQPWLIPVLSLLTILVVVGIVVIPDGEFVVTADFLTVGPDGDQREIHNGDPVFNGERIVLRYESDAKAYVYVWCDSTGEKEESYGLFPNDDLELENPLPAGQELLLPGTLLGDEFAWSLDDEPGVQEFHLHVSRERIDRLDREIRAMTHPEIELGIERVGERASALAETTRSLEGVTRGIGHVKRVEGLSGNGQRWKSVIRSKDGSIHCVLRFKQVDANPDDS